jgi:hypothetical protein
VALYQPSAFPDAAEVALQTYQALVAAANTSSSLETRSSISTSLQQLQRQWTKRHFSPKKLNLFSSFNSPRAIAMDSKVAVAAERKKALGTRVFVAEPDYDFSAPATAIACGDGIDTPHVTTANVFGEIVYAASTVSQLFGPEWFPIMYCHRYVPPSVNHFFAC